MKTPVSAALAAAVLLAAAPAGAATKTAVFAGGCFWSVEKFFESKRGVVRAVSGFSGGTRTPTYKNHEGHLEAVRVTYDPAKVTYGQLVDHFFRNIDPTDNGGQICDRGPSYRTAIFAATPEERRIAEQAKVRVAAQLKRPVATEVRNASRFWDAEAYHQDFAKKNPAQYERYRVGCGRNPWLKRVWGGKS